MYEISVVVTVIFMIVAAVDYVRCAWNRKTEPVPSTWILVVMGMTLSLWMYWVSPSKTWTGNIGVISAFVNTSAILAGVIAANIRWGTLRIAFDDEQKYCLAAGGGVFVFWYLTDQPFVAYILVQVIVLIGYYLTMKKLWRTRQCTEPLFVWVAVLAASLTALYPAWVKGDVFAGIFLARAIPSTALLIFLIAKIKRRPKEKTRMFI